MATAKMKCWECGKIATKRIGFNYDESTKEFIRAYLDLEDVNIEDYYYRCYCDRCLKEVEDRKQKESDEYIRLKKRMMFYKAVDMLEKQNTKMYEYKEAIDVVEAHLIQNPDKYDSSYEVLASIVLVHNRIYSKRQYKVGRYMVDFLLPEHGVVLEIDGERHKYHKVQDKKRDEFIKKKLGYGWDIIRIKTEYLDQNAKKLPQAIEAVVEYRETNHIPWRRLQGQA